MDVKLTNIELKILTALVSGRLSAAIVNTRFESNQTEVANLLLKKLIRFDGSYYAIALDGRSAIRKGATVISTPATIGLKDAKAMIEKTEISEPLVSEKTIEKSHVLRALEYIEAHPNCKSTDLTKAGIKQGTTLIRKFILVGQVLVIGKTGMGHRPAYRLADGLTAQDIYRGQADKVLALQEKKYKGSIFEARAVQKEINELREASVDVNANSLAASLKMDAEDIENDIKDARFDIQDIEPVIAYDSHKRLAIDEMVLTQKQTTELLAFVQELGLVG